jgi:glycosyltransferase involved in cell wall biosynthesis
MKGLKNHGKKVHVYLRHGYPLDRNDFFGDFKNSIDIIEDVEYHFNPSNHSSGMPEIDYSDVFNFSKFEEYHDLCVSTLKKQTEALKPSIIHAASNFVVGIAAINVAKTLGIPSIYEIRGFWHITQASKRVGYDNSDHYMLSESMELEAASRADYVFTITQGIADILIDYGISENKISILPNAVDIEKFNPIERDHELEDELELYEKVVLGYIGSFVEYEGLDLLLQAVALIRDEVGEYFRVILVGDGLVFDELLEMARFLGINDIVTFTGRVPHGDVQRYYSLIDITAFPRKGRRVCELVSPLKPFEAMAMKKAVIASNVKALSEIVQDGKTGLLHEKDNAESLADCIKKLVLDDKLRDNLASEGRKWVEKHRTWKTVTKVVAEKYDELQSS